MKYNNFVFADNYYFYYYYFTFVNFDRVYVTLTLNTKNSIKYKYSTVVKFCIEYTSMR